MSSATLDISPVERAKRIAAMLPDRAREVENARTLPGDVVDRLRESGLFALMTPSSLGGLEADPLTIVGVVEELSRADAATGWTVLIGQGGGYLAWLDPDVARAIVAEYPKPVINGSMAPLGKVTPAGATADHDTITLSGRWPYNSGCEIADLLIAAFTSAPSGNGGPPPIRFALFPGARAHIHDTWRVAGLRGTGSHDIEVSNLPVPVSHTFDPFGPARNEGALYRLPYMSYLMVAMAGYPLGVARRLLDEYRTIVGVKRNTERVVLAETPMIQSDIAHCEATVRSARCYVLEAVNRIWEEAQGGTPTPVSRATLSNSVQHAMRTAVDVADRAMRACGASQLYDRAPLQRLFRDTLAGAQHIAFSLDAQRRVGAVMLGLDVPLTHV